jgi:hypothetical protein
MDLTQVDIDPTLVPDFYEVVVGRYRERLVAGTITAGFIAMDDPPKPLATHREPCDLPRTETRMRWVKGWQ